MEPTTLDIKSLMNTDKIKNEDNELLEDIDDLMKDDIMNNYNKDDNNDNDVNNDNNDNDDIGDIGDIGDINDINDDAEENKEQQSDPSEINPNDFKEILDNGEFDNLSPQQQRIIKYDLLMKLADLVKTNGIQITTDYNMNSNYYDIKREYDYHVRVRGKKRAISTMYSVIICAAKGLEFLNNKFDPFGLNINGFTLNLESSREELLDVLMELYDKYLSTQGKEISPEMQLVFIFIKALVMTMVTNTATSYISSLFDKPEFNKNEIKQKLNNQNQVNQPNPIFNRSSNVMEEFKKEAELRDIKLSPMPDIE